MSTTVAIDEAQSKLKDIIATLGPRDEVVITENNRPVARLVATAKGQPRFGNCKGMLTVVAEDDEHLEDFQDYMP
jgi:antitoxin (DNA-binding transcriptional repressor) of toxin-antitoxin stability system